LDAAAAADKVWGGMRMLRMLEHNNRASLQGDTIMMADIVRGSDEYIFEKCYI
jgi:hypothetical protein